MGARKRNEDNVVAVIYEAVKYYRIRVSITTIRDYLHRHPYYPSLKSVCDAFTKWSIDHYPLELTDDEIRNLEIPYIAHRNIAGGQLVFALNNEDNTVKYTTGKGKETTEAIEVFLKDLSGAVIVYLPAEGSGEKEYRAKRQHEVLNKLLIPLSVVFSLVVLVGLMAENQIIKGSANSWRSWSLLFTKTLGLLTSFFLVQQELKVKNPFTDRICHLTEKTDCNTVLESGSSNVFGWINWADIGFIYFTGGLAFLITACDDYGISILTILSILVLPYPFYSFYLQAFRLNKFCPLCLTVQITLVAEFLILLPVLNGLTLDAGHIITFLAVFSLTAVIYLMIREILSLRSRLLSKTYRYNTFKRNPIIFRYLFNEGYKEKSTIPECLVVGNEDTNVVLHAFLSLYCKPCAKAFRSLEYLFNNCDNLKFNIILTGNQNIRDFTIIKLCYDFYIERNTDKVMNVLSEWYRNLENRTRMQLPVLRSSELQVSEGILNKNRELYRKNEISGTPTLLINSFKYPGQYEITDLEYYIDDIIELLEKKKQEACNY